MNSLVLPVASMSYANIHATCVLVQCQVHDLVHDSPIPHLHIPKCLNLDRIHLLLDHRPHVLLHHCPGRLCYLNQRLPALSHPRFPNLYRCLRLSVPRTRRLKLLNPIKTSPSLSEMSPPQHPRIAAAPFPCRTRSPLAARSQRLPLSRRPSLPVQAHDLLLRPTP